MKRVVAPVKNIIKLQVMHDDLRYRSPGVPGIGLLYGRPGYGKTTGIAHLVAQTEGVYLRAKAIWTPHTMLAELTKELEGPAMHSNSKMLAYCIETLASRPTPRTIFCDEADYVSGDKRLVETLRDIHDESGAPLVLIGMDGIDRRLKERPQFTRRISQWCEFQPIDLNDTRKLIEAVCEVAVADDLAQLLHKETGGSIGLMTVGLARIETFARHNNLDAVDATRWGKSRRFAIGAQPKT